MKIRNDREARIDAEICARNYASARDDMAFALAMRDANDCAIDPVCARLVTDYLNSAGQAQLFNAVLAAEIRAYLFASIEESR